MPNKALLRNVHAFIQSGVRACEQDVPNRCTNDGERHVFVVAEITWPCDTPVDWGVR